jgi:hypothetical protein
MNSISQTLKQSPAKAKDTSGRPIIKQTSGSNSRSLQLSLLPLCVARFDSKPLPTTVIRQ